jgi:hypothetical protein
MRHQRYNLTKNGLQAQNKNEIQTDATHPKSGTQTKPHSLAYNSTSVAKSHSCHYSRIHLRSHTAVTTQELIFLYHQSQLIPTLSHTPFDPLTAFMPETSVTYLQRGPLRQCMNAIRSPNRTKPKLKEETESTLSEIRQLQLLELHYLNLSSSLQRFQPGT